MAFQYSATVINAKLDAVETAVGTAPSLLIFSGSEPANCAAADPAGVLATIVLPSDWMNAASSPTKTKLGTWSVAASGTGTAASWRIKQGATCHIQGNMTDMTLDNTSIASGQVVTVNTFTITSGNQ
jgi:hypothetical protein